MRSNLISRVQRSVNNQLANFRFHNSATMRRVRFNYSNVCVCSWNIVATALPRKCEQNWSISTSCRIWGTCTANRFHGGRGQPTTFFTKFQYTEWLLSNEFIASGQALTAKYHIVHPFVIRGLTRTTAAEFCCPPKNVQNKSWFEELWSITKGSHPFKKVQFFWTLFKRPLTPPPFYLNICPILQGVFSKRVFEHLI